LWDSLNLERFSNVVDIIGNAENWLVWAAHISRRREQLGRSA
jgi:hypothetical protein